MQDTIEAGFKSTNKKLDNYEYTTKKQMFDDNLTLIKKISSKIEDEFELFKKDVDYNENRSIQK